LRRALYYSDKIFGLAGFTTPHDQTIATIISVGVVNWLATLIAIAWIDKSGREPLLYAGLIGMTVALVALAAFPGRRGGGRVPRSGSARSPAAVHREIGGDRDLDRRRLHRGRERLRRRLPA
jgi:hypothetical protein